MSEQTDQAITTIEDAIAAGETAAADLTAARAHEAELASELDAANEQIAELLGQQDGGTPPAVVLIEAEAFAASGAFEVVDDFGASNGKAVTQAVGVPNSGSGTPTDEIAVSLAAGAYDVWARLSAPDAAHDAMYLGLDGDLARIYPSSYGAYEWVQAPSVTVQAGDHQLGIANGESGVRIDAVAVAVAGTPVADLDAELEMMTEPPPRSAARGAAAAHHRAPAPERGSRLGLQGADGFDPKKLPAAAQPYVAPARAALAKALPSILQAFRSRDNYAFAREGGRLLHSWTTYLRLTGDPSVLSDFEQMRDAMQEAWTTSDHGELIFDPSQTTNEQMDSFMAWLPVALVGLALDRNGRDATACKRFLHRPTSVLGAARRHDHQRAHLPRVHRETAAEYLAAELLGDNSWRDLAETHRAYLDAHSIPCGDAMVWPHLPFQAQGSWYAQNGNYARYTTLGRFELHLLGFDSSRWFRAISEWMVRAPTMTLAWDTQGEVERCGIKPHAPDREWGWADRLDDMILAAIVAPELRPALTKWWADGSSHSIPGVAVAMLGVALNS